MRLALLFCLLAACRPATQSDVRRDASPIAGQSTSDTAARGVEPAAALGDVRPAGDGGYGLPGSRAAAAEKLSAAEEAMRRPNGEPDHRAPSPETPDRAAATPDLSVSTDARPTAGSEAGPCQDNEECTSTRVPPGGCCASLCTSRPITKLHAAEQEKRKASCRECPQPLCRPSAGARVPACVQGICALLRQSAD